MDLATYVGAGGIVVVIALVQAVKVVIPDLDKRWLPLVALVLAAIWGALGVWALGGNPREAVLMAVIVALSAIGLFSGGRAVAGR